MDDLTMPRRGRPTVFDPDKALVICERLAAGESLRSICRDDAMPARTTIILWSTSDPQGFAAQYARARETGYHEMADELLEIADDKSEDKLDREAVHRSRLRADTRKWLLSKMLPKVYGEKVQHTGDADEPIVTRVEYSWAVAAKE